VSSGGRKVWRLSRRGNRTVNHAIHMAAVTQVRHRNSPGRGYYDRKIAQGKTPREALRALKRRISDVLWAAMVADARHAAATTAAAAKAGPGGQPGNDSVASAAGSHPDTPALRPSHSRTRPKATTTKTRSRRTTPRTSARTRRTP
jgi:transposase